MTDPKGFIARYGGGDTMAGSRYGIPPTVGGGAPTPKPQVTDGGPNSGPVPLTTEPGYMGQSASTTWSKDSGPA